MKSQSDERPELPSGARAPVAPAAPDRQIHLEVWRGFRLGAFATGDYFCRCVHCAREFTGDKRALLCLPCAASAVERRGETIAQLIAGAADDQSMTLGGRLWEAWAAEVGKKGAWRDQSWMLACAFQRAAVAFLKAALSTEAQSPPAAGATGPLSPQGTERSEVPGGPILQPQERIND